MGGISLRSRFTDYGMTARDPRKSRSARTGDHVVVSLWEDRFEGKTYRSERHVEEGGWRPGFGREEMMDNLRAAWDGSKVIDVIVSVPCKHGEHPRRIKTCLRDGKRMRLTSFDYDQRSFVLEEV